MSPVLTLPTVDFRLLSRPQPSQIAAPVMPSGVGKKCSGNCAAGPSWLVFCGAWIRRQSAFSPHA